MIGDHNGYSKHAEVLCTSKRPLKEVSSHSTSQYTTLHKTVSPGKFTTSSTWTSGFSETSTCSYVGSLCHWLWMLPHETIQPCPQTVLPCPYCCEIILTTEPCYRDLQSTASACNICTWQKWGSGRTLVRLVPVSPAHWPTDWFGDRFIALMVEAVQTSETLVNSYRSTRRYNPEHSHLRTHGIENLNCCNITAGFSPLWSVMSPRQSLAPILLSTVFQIYDEFLKMLVLLEARAQIYVSIIFTLRMHPRISSATSRSINGSRKSSEPPTFCNKHWIMGKVLCS
jgi:hypothetical protein